MGEGRRYQEWTCDHCGFQDLVSFYHENYHEFPKDWEAVSVGYAESRGGRYVLCDHCARDVRPRLDELLDWLGAAIVYPLELGVSKS